MELWGRTASAKPEIAARRNAGRLRRWEALLLGGEAPGSRDAYEGAKRLLDNVNLPYRRIDQLPADPLNDILVRIERLANRPADSPLVSRLRESCL